MASLIVDSSRLNAAAIVHLANAKVYGGSRWFQCTRFAFPAAGRETHSAAPQNVARISRGLCTAVGGCLLLARAGGDVRISITRLVLIGYRLRAPLKRARPNG